MGGETICNIRGNIPSAISMIRGIMDWEDVNSKGTEEYIGDGYKHKQRDLSEQQQEIIDKHQQQLTDKHQ